MTQSILFTIFPSLDHSQEAQQDSSQISVSAAMSMCPVAGPSGQTMDQEAVLSTVRSELENDHHSQLIKILREFYEKNVIILNDNPPL